jgi:hypothetical protein
VILPAVAGLVTLVTILLLASRGSGTAAPRAAASPPQRDTAADAQVAARQVFQLYGEGQYRTVYADLVPAVRSAVPESTWVAVHEQCRLPAADTAYTVAGLELSGQTAVVTLTLGPSSQTQVLDFIAGKWLWVPSGQDLSAYQGSVAQIVRQLKADGYCSS